MVSIYSSDEIVSLKEIPVRMYADKIHSFFPFIDIYRFSSHSNATSSKHNSDVAIETYIKDNSGFRPWGDLLFVSVLQMRNK